jgi:hypothetical protein
MLLVATLGLGALAAPASAGVWTPIESNTTEDITAIEYQSADRFRFATAAGKLTKRKKVLFRGVPRSGRARPPRRSSSGGNALR